MQAVIGLWDRLDPKLKYTVIVFAVARVVAALAIPWDPAAESVASGLIAGLVGYRVPNEASVARRGAFDDGNAVVPGGLRR